MRPDPPARPLDELARTRDILDLHEGRGPVAVLKDDAVVRVLADARRIAIVGASSRPWRASNDVMATLLAAGYDCVPINPREATVHGIAAHPTVQDATEAGGPFDIVDVFRRAELCPPHAEDAVAAGARCLWLQLGIVSWDAARIAAAAGLDVVMDRCTAIELRRIGR
jgi:predicted CoA-binding protein